MSTINALLEVDKEDARKYLLSIHSLKCAAGGGGLPAPTDERARAATAQQAVEAAKKLRKESVRKADSSTPLMASNFSAEQKKRLSQLMFESGI